MSDKNKKIFSKINSKVATLFRHKSASVTSLNGSSPTPSAPGKPVACTLCGLLAAILNCEKCDKSNFCSSCDDAYHRHPKRRFHLRKAIPKPVSPASCNPFGSQTQLSSAQKMATLTRGQATFSDGQRVHLPTGPAGPMAPPRSRRSMSRAGSTETVNSTQTSGLTNTLRRHSEAQSAGSSGVGTSIASASQPKTFESALDEWASRNTMSRRSVPYSGVSTGSNLSVDILPQQADIHFRHNDDVRGRFRSDSLSRRNASMQDLNGYEQMALAGRPYGAPLPPPFPGYNQYGVPWAGHPMYQQYYPGQEEDSDSESASDDEDDVSLSVSEANSNVVRANSRSHSRQKSGRTSTLKRTRSSGSFNGMPWGMPPPPPPLQYMGYPYAPQPFYGHMRAPSPPRSVKSMTMSRGRHRANSTDGDSVASASQAKGKEMADKNGSRRGQGSRKNQSASSSRYQSEADSDEDVASISGDEKPRMGWTCRHCTYINDPSVDICDICGKSGLHRHRSVKNKSSQGHKEPAVKASPLAASRPPIGPPKTPVAQPTVAGLDLSDELVREQLEIEKEMKRRRDNEERIRVENEKIDAQLAGSQPISDEVHVQTTPETLEPLQQQDGDELDDFDAEVSRLIENLADQSVVDVPKMASTEKPPIAVPVAPPTVLPPVAEQRQMLMPTPPPPILSQVNPVPTVPLTVGYSGHVSGPVPTSSGYDQWANQHVQPPVPTFNPMPQSQFTPIDHGQHRPHPFYDNPYDQLRRPPLPYGVDPLASLQYGSRPGPPMSRHEMGTPQPQYVHSSYGQIQQSRYGSHDDLQRSYPSNGQNAAQAQQMATGMEILQILREAERKGYNADEVEIALNFNANNPLDWLEENWNNMLETVLTLSNNQIMQNEAKRNKGKGAILNLTLVTEAEVRVSLRAMKGNIWQAIEKCVVKKEEDRLIKQQSMAAIGSRQFSLEFQEPGTGRDNMDALSPSIKSNEVNSLIEKWSQQKDEAQQRHLSAKERFLMSSNDNGGQEAEDTLRRFLMKKYMDGDYSTDEESDLEAELGIHHDDDEDDDDDGEYFSDENEFEPEVEPEVFRETFTVEFETPMGVTTPTSPSSVVRVEPEVISETFIVEFETPMGTTTPTRPSSVVEVVGQLIDQVVEAVSFDIETEVMPSPAEIVTEVTVKPETELDRVRRVHESSNFGYARSVYECELCAGIYGITGDGPPAGIREKQRVDIPCPFCNLPDLGPDDEEGVYEYLGLLDQLIRTLLPGTVHELFQSKVRDRALAQDPNFRWCTYCSSGYIASNPHAKTIMCPDCKITSCIKCCRKWEPQHYGITCDQFAEWKLANDPSFADLELDKHLRRHGIDCPKCGSHFELSKGGCMHFHCLKCDYDFCGACRKQFLMGSKCKLSPYCEKLGLHAHHPRNCLFYLRDKEPLELQQLLTMNNVDHLIAVSDEAMAAKGCPVMEQKETQHGFLDVACGRPNEFYGSCRIHYIEYLGELIMKHNIDPIDIFDVDQLEQVMRRSSIKLPVKCPNYKDALIQAIMKECPLD
ncbi:E3 ubiquitin-protein ligase RNF31 [Halotydeus destructor]|nr:E3 ubiquitin-protein ligase RNF31 [Halotydeus destructor]